MDDFINQFEGGEVASYRMERKTDNSCASPPTDMHLEVDENTLVSFWGYIASGLISIWYIFLTYIFISIDPTSFQKVAYFFFFMIGLSSFLSIMHLMVLLKFEIARKIAIIHAYLILIGIPIGTILGMIIIKSMKGKQFYNANIHRKSPPNYDLLASHRKTIGLSISVIIILIVLIFKRETFIPPFDGEIMEIDSPNNAIYYDKEISTAEVKILGEFLINYGYFRSDIPQRINFKLVDDKYVVQIFVNKNWWKDRDILESLLSIQEDLSKNILFKDVEIIMLQDGIIGRKKMSVNSALEQISAPNNAL